MSEVAMAVVPAMVAMAMVSITESITGMLPAGASGPVSVGLVRRSMMMTGEAASPRVRGPRP